MQFLLNQSQIDSLTAIQEHIVVDVNPCSIHDEEFDQFYFIITIHDWQEFATTAIHCLTPWQLTDFMVALEFYTSTN